MNLSSLNLELLTSAGVGLVVFAFAVICYLKVRKTNDYKPFPVYPANVEEITLQQVAKDMQDNTDVDNTDVDTEVINTMDYHQLPKELVAEKARRLASGEM